MILTVKGDEGSYRSKSVFEGVAKDVEAMTYSATKRVLEQHGHS